MTEWGVQNVFVCKAIQWDAVTEWGVQNVFVRLFSGMLRLNGVFRMWLFVGLFNGMPRLAGVSACYVRMPTFAKQFSGMLVLHSCIIYLFQISCVC